MIVEQIRMFNVQKLEKVLPKEEEFKLIEAKKGSLTNEELFMYTLGSIPMLSERLSVMKFHLAFSVQEEVHKYGFWLN